MHNAERKRQKEETTERVEGAGWTLLTTGQNRYFLNSKASLVVLKRTKLSAMDLG